MGINDIDEKVKRLGIHIIIRWRKKTYRFAINEPTEHCRRLGLCGCAVEPYDILNLVTMPVRSSGYDRSLFRQSCKVYKFLGYIRHVEEKVDYLTCLCEYVFTLVWESLKFSSRFTYSKEILSKVTGLLSPVFMDINIWVFCLLEQFLKKVFIFSILNFGF